MPDSHEFDPQAPPRSSSLDGPCRAVVDVGTNSVKLLVARVSGSSVVPLFERGIQTRLGAGLFAHGYLLPEAIARTAEAVRTLCTQASEFRPERLRVLATAAAREARNPNDLLAALLPACGTDVEIVDGDLEADLAFRGVATDPALAERPLLVTDVGGGSTEFIVGTPNAARPFRRSFPIGAVRLLESLALDDPPGLERLAACRRTVDTLFEDHVAPAIVPLCRRASEAAAPLAWIAVGGTAVVLARLILALDTFDRERIESVVLDADPLVALTERLWSLPLAERRRLPGLPPERADIVLTGAAIYEGAFRALPLPSLRPSTRGLRYAALLDPK